MRPTLGARAKLLVFGLYSFVENIGYLLLELLPPPLRHLVFRLVLKHMGPGAMIDYRCYLRYPWRISIGAGSSVNRGCELFGSMMDGRAQIVIGRRVALGPRVRILSAAHDYRHLDLPDTSASVTIGDYVWVGAGATILPGVSIGEGAVIGAASVVSRDVDAYTVVAGTPARFIKKRELHDASTV